MDNFDEKLQKLLNNPEALAQVAKLAEGLGGGSGQPKPPPEPPKEPQSPSVPSGGDNALQSLLTGIDPKMLTGLVELAGEFNRKDDRRIALLNALRPYVRNERRHKMDRAAELVQLARVIRRGLGLLGGG